MSDQAEEGSAEALAEQLYEQRSRIREQAVPVFDRLYAELRDAADAETARGRLERLFDHVEDNLPPGAPAFALRRWRFATETATISRLPGALAAYFGAGAPGRDPGAARAYDPQRAADELAGELLAAPAYTPEDLLRRGVDAGHPHLIRLRRADGRFQLPAFQFGPDGTARALVLEVNELIGAGEDPWGAADWWLAPHNWLPLPPASSLDIEPDETILRAARIVGEVV
jgi:hypothetical protein